MKEEQFLKCGHVVCKRTKKKNEKVKKNKSQIGITREIQTLEFSSASCLRSFCSMNFTSSVYEVKENVQS